MPNELLTTYNERQPLLQQVQVAIEAETKAALKDLPHIDRVSFRVKGGPSFIAKSFDANGKPLYEKPLIEVEDQVAGRIIVFFLHDIEIVLEALKKTFNAIERTRKHPERDEEFGYESFHLICNIPPHVKPDGWSARDDLPGTFEIQVRTLFMHAYAEPQHDMGYKAANELPPTVRRELAWIAASAWGADQAYERVWAWANKRGESAPKKKA